MAEAQLNFIHRACLPLSYRNLGRQKHTPILQRESCSFAEPLAHLVQGDSKGGWVAQGSHRSNRRSWCLLPASPGAAQRPPDGQCLGWAPES